MLPQVAGHLSHFVTNTLAEKPSGDLKKEEYVKNAARCTTALEILTKKWKEFETKAWNDWRGMLPS